MRPTPFLQATDGNPLIVLYIVGSILAILVVIYITRLIFSIPTIVKHSKAQTAALILIAKKNGATDEEIQEIKNISNSESL